jgi:hypothetical protein
MGSELSFFERLRNRRTKDIELPNTSGKVDKRLEKPNVMGQLGKAAEGLKALKKVAARKGGY